MKKTYLIICLVLAWGLLACNRTKQGYGTENGQEETINQDSIAKSVKDSVKQKMVSDSIAKAKADSTASAKKAAEFDIAKIYAVCKKGVDGRHYPALPAMGFKKGPSFSQDVPFGYSNYFYRNCEMKSAGGSTEASKLTGPGLPLVVSVGKSDNSPFGWFQVEVFDKESLKKAKEFLRKKDKGNKYGTASLMVSKSKLGWFVSVDFPSEW
jgi:hypothetical protein